MFPNGVVTGHELQVDALPSQTCRRKVVRMDSCAPNGPKICASVWTCGAESGAERWNRASGVESAAERRDASPDGSLGGRDERAFWRLERTGAGGSEERPLSVESGKEMALPPSPPLRTGRETFASSGSSHFKALREQ